MTLEITDPRALALLALLACLLLILFVALPALFIWKARQVGFLPPDWRVSGALSRAGHAFNLGLREHGSTVVRTGLGFGVFWGGVVLLFGFSGSLWAALIGGGLLVLGSTPTFPKMEEATGWWVGEGTARWRAAQLNEEDSRRRDERYLKAVDAYHRYASAYKGLGAVIWLIPAVYTMLSLILQQLFPFRGLLPFTR